MLLILAKTDFSFTLNIEHTIWLKVCSQKRDPVALAPSTVRKGSTFQWTHGQALVFFEVSIEFWCRSDAGWIQLKSCSSTHSAWEHGFIALKICKRVEQINIITDVEGSLRSGCGSAHLNDCCITWHCQRGKIKENWHIYENVKESSQVSITRWTKLKWFGFENSSNVTKWCPFAVLVEVRCWLDSIEVLFQYT